MKKIFLLLVALFNVCLLHAQTSADVTFQISTQVSASPAFIKLTWRKVNGVSNYTVSRKLRSATAWSTLSSSLAVNDTSYTDNTALPAESYEYRVSDPALNVTGFVHASIALPAVHRSGKIILLVDSAYHTSLAAELTRLELDLILEGWMPVRRTIGRGQSVATVKQQIRTIYEADPQAVKGVLLLGHIPVPYSGLLNPDGHPDHRGAWPADVYYGDTSSTFWTDVSVNDTAASRAANDNIPGDGKFDQSVMPLPSITKMYIGRVDVFDMPAFSSNDTLLMKRYLEKDHAYRRSQTTFRMRGLIDDNFGYFSGEAFGQNGYRNLASLLGPDSVLTGDYFSDMKAGSYLWSYGCGGGTYTSAGGVGSTGNFQTDTVQTVFTMLFGSYFGDWDIQNNFLRAPLASPGAALTNCWAGRPNAFFHHMGLGEPIGSSFLESVKVSTAYHPAGYGSRFVHQALMGDPTLRMYMYEGAGSLLADSIAGASIAQLNWSASADPQVLGYYVYRAASLNDSFSLVTPTYLSTTTWNDSSALQGKNVYMVRAVKLQTANSGRFYNLSTGVVDSTWIQTPFGINEQEQHLVIDIFPNPARDRFTVSSPEDEIQLLQIYDLHGRLLQTYEPGVKRQTVATTQWVPGTYTLRITTSKGFYATKLTVMNE